MLENKGKTSEGHAILKKFQVGKMLLYSRHSKLKKKKSQMEMKLEESVRIILLYSNSW